MHHQQISSQPPFLGQQRKLLNEAKPKWSQQDPLPCMLSPLFLQPGFFPHQPLSSSLHWC